MERGVSVWAAQNGGSEPWLLGEPCFAGLPG